MDDNWKIHFEFTTINRMSCFLEHFKNYVFSINCFYQSVNQTAIYERDMYIYTLLLSPGAYWHQPPLSVWRQQVVTANQQTSKSRGGWRFKAAAHIKIAFFAKITMAYCYWLSVFCVGFFVCRCRLLPERTMALQIDQPHSPPSLHPNPSIDLPPPHRYSSIFIFVHQINARQSWRSFRQPALIIQQMNEVLALSIFRLNLNRMANAFLWYSCVALDYNECCFAVSAARILRLANASESIWWGNQWRRVFDFMNEIRKLAFYARRSVCKRPRPRVGYVKW